MPGPLFFAWAGGVIVESQTVVTNGNTHGGVVETVTIVGDVETGTAQLLNIASFSGLTEGDLYFLSGPGIVDGTYFIYDQSILTLPGSVNLSLAATGTLTSATYSATKAIQLGAVAATLTAGSSTVALGEVDLPAGIYSIYGTGIGETDADVDVLIVPSAWFDYDGSSGLAQMFVHAALTDGGVISQEVRSTTTGLYSLGITGAPDADWYSITSIPAAALSTLTAGLRYNISGTGLDVGTTFIAPASGATAIDLDVPASSSTLNAILTITGPRTADAGFDPVVHNREDEQIVGLEIAQEEGGFATLTIDILNPNVGLLALGRNLWCWLSWDQAWTPQGGATPDLVPLFNGRLVGVPKLSTGEIVSLQFLARPDDFNGQKAALVSDLQVLPYYDPVWLASNVNPDTVLETYSSLWHVDRTTLEVTTSDILQGEDGTIVIGEDAAFYDAFSLSYGSPPLIGVTVSGTVSWQQQGDGFLDVTQDILDAFAKAGSPYKQVFGTYYDISTDIKDAEQALEDAGQNDSGGGLISCMCGDGLRTDWPKPGTSIGGGWNLSTRNDGGVPLCYCIDAQRPNGWMQAEVYAVKYAGQDTPVTDDTTTTDTTTDSDVLTAPYGRYKTSFPISIYKVRMVLEWRADRTRTETASAIVAASVQRELSDSADSDHEDLALTSEYVGRAIDGGEIPIGDLTRRSYFQTDRGAQSFEYLLLAARAKIRARSRAADITFAVDWRTAIRLTLRNSVTYNDRRLPGGTATGKVKAYKLTVGEGIMFGEFTIGCAVGNDEPTIAADGTPTYVETDYTDPGYNIISGQQKVLIDNELAYQTLDDFVIADDGLDLTNMTRERAVSGCIVVNGIKEQLDTLRSYQDTVTPTRGDPVTAMRQLSTRVTLNMKPVAGNSFNTNFYPAVSQLWLPKTIDLAASGG